MEIFAYRLPYGKHRKKDLDTLKFMAATGVDLISISPMNTADSLGNPYTDAPLVWRAEDVYDFASLDAQFDEVLSVHPKARFICTVDLNTPLWFARKLSEDSFYSLSNLALNREWKNATTSYLRHFLEHCEAFYGNSIWGYVPACGRTMEWIENDFEKDGLLKGEAFQRYCSENGLGKLQIPTMNSLLHSEHEFIRDPEKERNIVEWRRFTGKVAADLLIHFIQTIRETVPRNKKIGVFYGFVLNLFMGLHSDCERVFDTMPPDFMIGAACNSKQAIGNNSGFNAVTKMLSRRKIGYLHECDRITSTSNLQITDFVSLNRSGIWTPWASSAEDIAGFRREVSMCLIENFSFWAFNIWGQSYKSPELRAAIKNCFETWKMYRGLSSGSTAQILFVADMESNFWLNEHHHAIFKALAWNCRNNLMECGVPYDTAVWNDLAEIDLSQYRIILFQNLVWMTAEREKVLFSKICKDNRLIVWCGTPGILYNGKYDRNHVEALCGNPYTTQGFAKKVFPDWISFSVADPLLLNDIAFVRHILDQGKLHCYCKDAAVRHSKEFLMIHCKKGGEKQIHLPGPVSKITEVFSGKTMPGNGISFTDQFETPDTKLYYFSK